MRAADIFVNRKMAHVCWAVAIADGFPSVCYRYSPAVKKLQHDFAALEAGATILQSGDMLNAVDGDEQGFREFSLMLLAFAAAAAA